MLNPEESLFQKNEATEEELSGENEKEMNRLILADEDLRRERADRQIFEDLKRFKGTYPDGKIIADMNLVKERRRMSSDHAVRGQLLETVLSEYADMAGWFGDAAGYRASEYDDRKHGVDVIFESETPEGKPVYLAVDCTVSENRRALDGKIDSIIADIERDVLTTVEYFESERTEMKGALHFVPKVIIAMEPRRMEELAGECLPVLKKEKNRYKKLENSYLQIFFLRQIEAQLKKQFQLARLPKEDLKPHRKEVVEAIGNALKYIQETLKQKENSLDQDLAKRASKEYDESGMESALVPSG